MECIKRRMLFACYDVYEFAPPAASRKVAWLEDPRKIVRNAPDYDEPIDFAYVGRIPEGILVAFRGTVPPFRRDTHRGPTVFFDWANNASFKCREIDPFPGGVHEGFAGSTNRLWGGEDDSGVKAAIDALLADPATQPALFFTGHSKGGALANLAAYRASRAWPDLPIRVFTAAAARAGNAAFRQDYEARRIKCVRYEATLDLVPYLPFGADLPPEIRRFLGRIDEALLDNSYVPIGRRVPENFSRTDWARALVSSLGSWFTGSRFRPRVPTVIAAHAIDERSGYDALVCTSEHGCAPEHRLTA